MSTEKLIVQLEADTSSLDSALDNTDTKINNLGESTKKTSSGFSGFAKSAKVAAGVVAAAAGAVTALTAKTVQYGKELQVAANRNQSSVESLQAIAFAANTVGISLEKIGDIGKDTNEKIGEFLATGGGGFQDFADVLGLTKNEATDLAQEFENLSGTDVLQEVVKRLEDAGASSDQVSFALEGLASDTTDLIPLLTNGGKAINDLTKEFDSLNVTLSQEDLDRISALGVELDKFTAKLSGQSRQAISDYAEEIVKAIQVTSEFLTTTVNVFNLIATGWGNVIEISQAAVTDLVNGTDTLGATLEARAKLSSEVIEKLAGDAAAGAKRIAEEVDLSAPEQALNQSEGIVANEEESPVIQKINKEVEAIKDRFKTETELLTEKLEREKELLDNEIVNEEERNALKLELEQEYQDNLTAIKNEAIQARVDKEKEVQDQLAKAEKLAQRDKAKQDKLDKKIDADKLSLKENNARQAIALASLVFEDSKAVSAGIAFINTAEGVTAALAKQNYVGAALTAATGAAQQIAILGASPGGGSSAPTPPSQAPTQPDFQADTEALELTDSTLGGSTTNEIRFATDSGDEIIDAIASALNKGQSEGRF